MTPAKASRKLFQLCFFSGLTALAIGACTVESGGSDDDCTPGKVASCKCSNGQTGEHVCKESGSGWDSCSCGAGGAGAGSGGNAGKGGYAGTTGSAGKAGSATNGGTAGYGVTGGSGGQYTAGGPGAGEGGVAAIQGGNGGEPSSSAGASGANTGGAGAGGTDPNELFAACNSCAGIICDTQLEACSVDATCFGATDDDLGEYGCMLDCIDGKRAESSNEFISSSEVSACAESCAGTGSGWSKGLAAETRDVFDCLADGTVTPGSAWSAPTNSNCTAECFGAGNN